MKELLDKINKWHKTNEKLYDRKSKLEQEILDIDIEMWKLDCEYNNLCRMLIENKNL